MDSTPVATALFCAAFATLPAAQEPGATPEKTTSSGLRYRVVKEGDGTRSPKPTEQVRVHYTGTFLDGKKFDSSRDRGQPTVFPLNGVIAGWTEGLQLMSPGARFEFTIPWALAYGEKGRAPVIPPKADLVFDVELIAIQPVMPLLDDAKVEKTESGAICQKITAGTGAALADGELPDFEFAIYDDGGTLRQGTWLDNKHLPSGDAAQIKFIQELLPTLRIGDKVCCQVPLGGGRPGKANWVLELVGAKKALAVPTFALPTDAELTKTASGLKYKVLKPGGAGAAPKMGQAVTVHYAGWLTDGKLFDASYGSGEPITFKLGEVIDGWNQGLQLMTPGATYVFVIPPDLGYGNMGSPPVIPAGATLVFHVELVEVRG